MQKSPKGLLFSATDLVNFLECEHLTALDRINLETASKFEREVYSESPGAPKPDGTYEPWQLVKKGVRYVYRCAESKQ